MADETRSQPPSNKLPTAKWGAACAACASAKAKCIRSDEAPGAKCDRCRRLLKECAGQVHRPRKKRQAKPSRTAQIEERLNGLVSLLQASGDLAPDTPGAAAGPEPPSAGPSPAASSPGAGAWAVPHTYNAHCLPACVCRPGAGDAPPPPDADDALLGLYRSTLQPLYPFVVVPSACSAAALLARRPFLMAAIRMVASIRSPRSMQAQMYHLMAHVADHMLIRSERSLDLLQGIVVMLGWYHYHCLVHAQLSNLVCLAMSLVAELGLNKPPMVRELASLVIVQPQPPSGRTNEERRALAAVWFMSSVMSTVLGRIEPMRYSPYLHECVRDLETGREFDTDTTLVCLVRIQHLTERICDHNHNLRDRAWDDVPGVPAAPPPAYIQAFQNELDRLRDSLPPGLKRDHMIQVHLNSATLRLYEPPVADMALVKQLSESLTSGTAAAGTPLDKLFQTSSALRAWFDGWLPILPTNIHLPAAASSQLAYALTMLGRWAKLATPRTMYQGATPMPRVVGLGSATLAMSEETGQPPKSQPVASGTRQPPGRRVPNVPETEPGLPAAVGALQSQLQALPGLAVDIPEILSAVCTRLEQVNAALLCAAPEAGRVENNVWSTTALRVRITRMKLERWAELVSAGAEVSSHEDAPSANSSSTPLDTGQRSGSYPQQQVVGAGLDAPGDVQFCSLAQDQTQVQNYLGSTSWTSTLVDGMDPTMLFDDYLDWGMVMMNPTGTMEQMGPNG